MRHGLVTLNVGETSGTSRRRGGGRVTAFRCAAGVPIRLNAASTASKSALISWSVTTRNEARCRKVNSLERRGALDRNPALLQFLPDFLFDLLPDLPAPSLPNRHGLLEELRLQLHVLGADGASIKPCKFF